MLYAQNHPLKLLCSEGEFSLFDKAPKHSEGLRKPFQRIFNLPWLVSLRPSPTKLTHLLPFNPIVKYTKN